MDIKLNPWHEDKKMDNKILQTELVGKLTLDTIQKKITWTTKYNMDSFFYYDKFQLYVGKWNGKPDRLTLEYKGNQLDLNFKDLLPLWNAIDEARNNSFQEDFLKIING